MGVRRTRYLPESCPSFMPRGTERSKQKWSETSVLRDCSASCKVCWQCSLHSIHNPASNSRPPISRRQSTFRFHFCNRLHFPEQSSFVLISRTMRARLRATELRPARNGTRHGVELPAQERRFPEPGVAMQSQQLLPVPRTNRVTSQALPKRPF